MAVKTWCNEDDSLLSRPQGLILLKEVSWTTIRDRTWISNYIPHKGMDMITYPCPELSEFMLDKETPGSLITVQLMCTQSPGAEDITNGLSGTNKVTFVKQLWVLTHWGRVTHIWVGKLTIIGSDNGLSPGRHQAIIQANAGILLIGPLGTNFSEILSEIHIFSFKKIHLKLSSGKWRPFCLGLNVLICMLLVLCYGLI